MDKEKLNKAAEEHSDAIGKDSYCSYTALFSFKQGANWLMQQPLSERLTNEEKEKIKAIYKRQGVECFQSIETATTRWVLEKIFGKDLFKENKLK